MKYKGFQITLEGEKLTADPILDEIQEYFMGSYSNLMNLINKKHEEMLLGVIRTKDLKKLCKYLNEEIQRREKENGHPETKVSEESGDSELSGRDLYSGC